MRRKDREVTQMDQILHIINQCEVCRVAFFDHEFPYIVPMNFGMEYQDGKVFLYFHCAKEGKKIDLLHKNPNVSFEMDLANRLVTGDLACDYTMEFESVIGYGKMEQLEDDEKIHGLNLLMQQYAPGQSFSFDERMVRAVTILRLNVCSLTAKSTNR